MSTLKSNTIEPATGTNLSLGAAGDLIDVTSDTLQLNTWKDSGGNTLFTSDGSGNLSSVNSALDIGGGPNLISTHTASSSSSVEITSGIDSTYDKYMFVCVGIHPSANSEGFQFQVSTDGGASYGVLKTTTAFQAGHYESGSSYEFQYEANRDRAQSTGAQWLVQGLGNDADQSCAGILHFYAPSSTTYVKQFYSRFQNYHDSNLSQDWYIGGYINTTSAVTAIKFIMSSGNIDAGTIKMYGCR